MNYPVDGFIEGPGLPQSIWRYKWLVGGLVLLGILSASLLSATQPTRYEAVVPIFLTADEAAANYPERMVMSHAQFIESPSVSDRVIALTGNRLTRKELERRLTVEPSANGDFITIRARDTTPRNAAELADAVELAYRQILSEQRKADAKGTIAGLEGVQRTLASELAQIKKQRRTVDSPALQAEEKAKKRQMDATANKIERISADTAGTGISPPALENKPAVSDDPVQPKPLRAAAIGAVVALVIGVALAWLLAARRRAMPGERTTASEIQESTGQVPQLADVDHNRATESVGQAVNSLNKDPELLYSLAEWLESQHQNFPQITAERLRDRLLFEKVAVLLKTDEGLDLAGCVGWHPDGGRRVRHEERRILDELGGNGVRQIGSADRRSLINAGLIGTEARTVVVAPLKHENVAFGVLLVGQEESDSEARPPGNGSFDSIGSFARSVAPDLHAWLLLHKLREQLGSHREADEQTTSHAVSESPSPESLPDSAQPLPASAQPHLASAELPDSAQPHPASAQPHPASAELPNSAQPHPASAEHPASASAELPASAEHPASASAELPASASAKLPASAEHPASASAELPASAEHPASAQPHPASAEPSAADSEVPFVWPTYPAVLGLLTPESQPASSIDQQEDHQVRTGQSRRSKRVRGASRH